MQDSQLNELSSIIHSSNIRWGFLSHSTTITFAVMEQIIQQGDQDPKKGLHEITDSVNVLTDHSE